jgi:hypothetical protein
VGPKNGFYGRKHKPESLLKMSEAHKQRCLKSIIQYTKTGDLVKIWPGIRQASRSLDICHANIVNCANKTIKTAGGFIWRYADDLLTADEITAANFRNHPRTKVLQYDLDNNFLQAFNSITEAAAAVNRSTVNISTCLKKNSNLKENQKFYTCGNYIWKYAKD